MNMEHTPRILIVEDDPDINNLIRTVLKKSGCRPVQAFSGTEAGLRLELERFDLIILDLMLPGMDGETLLGQIRGERQLDIPVLVLSARSALSDKVSLLISGADDYMTKPFEPEELSARVCACLRRSGRRQSRNTEKAAFSYKQLRLTPESRTVTVN